MLPFLWKKVWFEIKKKKNGCFENTRLLEKLLNLIIISKIIFNSYGYKYKGIVNMYENEKNLHIVSVHLR